MLVVFPLGLLTVAPIFDIVHFSTGNAVFADVTFWMLSAGLIGGLVAAVAGFIDFLGIPRKTRAYRVGLTHLFIMLCAVALYVLSWITRFRNPEGAGVGAFVLAVLGVGVIVVGGWFGGELVQRLGVGVYEDAHLDSPSSFDTERLVRRPTVTTPGPREPHPA
jgi:uncharacterized membrane protein